MKRSGGRIVARQARSPGTRPGSKPFTVSARSALEAAPRRSGAQLVDEPQVAELAVHVGEAAVERAAARAAGRGERRRDRRSPPSACRCASSDRARRRRRRRCAPARARGGARSSRLVSRKWPRWLTAKVSSKPSAESCGPVVICRPALQTSARSGRSRASISCANARTDAERAEVEPHLRGRAGAALARDAPHGRGRRRPVAARDQHVPARRARARARTRSRSPNCRR